MALLHGGQLQTVAQEYKTPTVNWLDLSTGIAPTSYPIPSIPLATWQELPQQRRTLIDAAQTYYQNEQLIITNGSQAIIKALPLLYRAKNHHTVNVYIPIRGYKEHLNAWQNNKYNIHFYHETLPPLTTLKPHSVLVVINPNNPTGCYFTNEVLAQYHRALKQLNGLLVIDEAFIDILPAEQSYCARVNDDHCIVLRSFGKFFGLAGIRIGFLIANHKWCQAFESWLGPWQVNGPAQLIAERALQDISWQQQQKLTLQHLRSQQEALITKVVQESLLVKTVGCDLFITLHFSHSTIAKKIYHSLCKQAIYCRLADEQDTLRLGIALEPAQQRLAIALHNASLALTASTT